MDQLHVLYALDVDRRTAQDEGDDSNCPVCMDTMRNPTTTTCGHTFCSECIATWLADSDHNTCPICRRRLIDGDVRQPEPETTHEEQSERRANPSRRREQQHLAIRNNLARGRINRLTADVVDLDNKLMVFIEDLFPSPNGSLLLRSIIRIRDIIRHEVNMLSTTHHGGPEGVRLDHLSYEEVISFHDTAREIRLQCTDLTGAISSLWRNVIERHTSADFNLRERLTDRWYVLCDELIERASLMTYALTADDLPA